MQSIDSIETHAYGPSKDLVSDKEEIKCNDWLWWCCKREHKKKHNLNWPQIPDHTEC